MSSIGDARKELAAALRTVDGLRVYEQPVDVPDAPAAILSLPNLRWENYCLEPTRATFQIVLAVKLDDRAIDNLQTIVLAAASAIDENVDGATVQQARTGAWDGKFPAYDLEVEVQL